MEISDTEFKESQRVARLMERFLSTFTGSADELDAAWEAYKFAPHPSGDTRPRKFAVDKYPTPGVPRHASTPSVDDLLASTERLLKIHELLHGVPSPEDRLTVPNRFRFKEEGDTYKPYYPQSHGFLESLEVSPEEMAERAKAELEEKVEALRQKRNTGLRGVLEARRSEADKHRNVLF